MHVETYTDKHFLDVVKLVENFHKEAVGEYDELLSPEAVIETIKAADPKTLFLLIIDGVCQGLLYGMISKSLTSGKMIFQEIMWYVNAPFRQYGVSLLKEVEKHLKSEGVSIIIMAVLENSKTEKLKRFYERLGYRPMETHYVRAI